MSYEVCVKIIIKTFGKTLTHNEMRKIIEDSLWKCDEFRDIQLYDYEGDTEDDEGII